MLEILQKSLPYEEKPQEGRDPIKKATQTPLAVSNRPEKEIKRAISALLKIFYSTLNTLPYNPKF